MGVLAGTFGGATITERLAAYLDNLPEIMRFGDPIAIEIAVIAITYLSLIMAN